MSVAATLPAGSLELSSCDVCGTADALGLGTCAACAVGDTDALLFFERSERRADRRAVEAWLLESLSGVVGRDEARDVSEGLRPVVGLPASVAGSVSGSLSLRGLAATSVPIGRAWRKTPPALVGLLGSILGAGLFVGLTVTPWMLALSVVFAGLLWSAAHRRLREPVWVPDPESVLGLPASVESTVRATLNRLSEDRAREYLLDLTTLAAGLLNPGDGEPAPDVPAAVEELLSLACDAAVDLENLDASLEVLERQTASGPIDVAMAEAAAQAATTRTRLARRFEDALASLGRLHAASVEAPAKLAELAGRLAEDAEHRARAWEAVRRLTA